MCQTPRQIKKGWDTKIPQSSGPLEKVGEEAVYKELGDRMEKAATTASSLVAEQDSGNINRTQSMVTSSEAQISFKAASKQSNDPPLSRVNILGSGEDSMKLMELMEHFNVVRLNLLLPVLVFAARHTPPAVRHKLMLLGITYYCWFWVSAKAKIVNRERQIQALVDKNKVIITETSIRSDFKLDDTEGIDCLPTALIFTELERIGYEHLTQKLTFYKAYFSSQWKFLIHTILQCLSAKTTAWNEFSSTMASAIICLATNQTFNFSKYIFDNLVKHLEGGVKFLMYPRFVQVFLDKQVEGMTRHKEVYVTPSHTKKVFANMKRPGKGFSGRVTPLFPTMMIQASEDMGEDSAAPSDSHSTPIISQPSSSKPQKKKSRRKQRKDSGPTEPVTDEAHVSTPSYDPPQSGEDSMQLSELMNLCTILQEKVLDLEKAKTAQAKEIASLKNRVKQLEKRRKLRTPRLNRLRKGRKIADINADAEVTLVDETQEMNEDNLMFDTGVLEEQKINFEKVVEESVVSVATTTKSFPVSAADPVTTASEVVTTASVEIPDELTPAQTLIEIKMKASETRTKESSKRAGDELESDKSKKQKIDKHVEAEKDDDPEEEEIKNHMKIVQDEEEIAIDAIPLAIKPPMIIEYKIVKEGQKGFYHLIRADGSSKRYSSMIKMLQGIDKEDLEIL
ncbi:hypothetical protein Tco_0644430 [Tanacetum coccineum]